MSFRERAVAFLNRNVVLITGGSIIVAVHWGWSKLQHNPGLVPEEKRTELPIIIGAKMLQKRMLDKIEEIRNPVVEDSDKPI